MLNPDRTCRTCACFARINVGDGKESDPDDAGKMPVCRLGPPSGNLIEREVEVPLMKKDGTPEMWTSGPRAGMPRVRLEKRPAVQLAYCPTHPEAVCWAWRPRWCPAGSRWEEIIRPADVVAV